MADDYKISYHYSYLIFIDQINSDLALTNRINPDLILTSRINPDLALISRINSDFAFKIGHPVYLPNNQ